MAEVAEVDPIGRWRVHRPRRIQTGSAVGTTGSRENVAGKSGGGHVGGRRSARRCIDVERFDIEGLDEEGFDVRRERR